MRVLVLLVPLLLVVAAPASAAVHIWNFDISEDQVKNSVADPPGDGSTDSLATGRGHLRYDSDADTLFYSISWDGLEGDLTALHIHGPADATMSTPNHLVEIFNTSQDVVNAGLDLRNDVTEGTIESFDDGMACDDGGALACFLEERAYVNVHSQSFTMGEIRGNLLLRPDYAFFDAVSTEDQVNNNAANPVDGSTDSPGIGYGHFRYDPDTETIDYTISWSGLQGNLIKLHVHGPADPGTSNPNHLLEIFNSAGDVTDAGIVDPRNASHSGKFLIDGTNLDCLTDDPLVCLIEERGYVNVHTEAFPMGEIRGNALLVPEPAASLLGAVALVACGLLRRAGAGVARRRWSAPH